MNHSHSSTGCGCGHSHTHENEGGHVHTCRCAHHAAQCASPQIETNCGCPAPKESSGTEENEAPPDGPCSCGCGHSHEPHSHSEACEDGCGCGHDHGVRPTGSQIVADSIKIGGALVLLACAWLAGQWALLQPVQGTVQFVLHLAAYLLVGYEVLWTAAKNVTRGKLFDENFLMAVATLGAFAIGDTAEAVAVMVFYGIGETLQNMAVAKSRENIATLMDIRPEFARVVRNGTAQQLPPEQVAPGETVEIHPGERVPLDCVVQTGEAAVDASALTGESVPVAAAPGVRLAAGSVCLNGVLTCTVESAFAQSTVQKILSLVSDASAKKAKAEKFITRFSKVYTPCVMAAAALIAVVPPFLLGLGTFSEWFYRGLIFLVVSCPCALVISVPVSFLGGIGGAAKNGVLVKGGEVIDLLAVPKVLVLDKTGTLTQGCFAVQRVTPAAGKSEATLLAAAALCERSSKHPIALSVRNHCAAQDSGEAFIAYEERAGYGIVATVQTGVYAAGNLRLMETLGIAVPQATGTTGESAGTLLHVAKDKEYLGTLEIADELKPDTKQALQTLRALGVEQCYMLTGDREQTAQAVAKAAGLDGYRAGLLPHEKVAAYEALTQKTQGVCLYAGDGINDAPVLARADVGIAMGGVGSDAAIEAADVVLMTDELTKIAHAIRVARQTRAIVKQNIGFALGVKAVVLLVAAFGYTPMWLAIFADVGVALIAIANASRAVRLHGEERRSV